MDGLRPTDEDYQWPCEKRKAHGRHQVVVEYCDHTRQSCEDIGCSGPLMRECPGVKAHPNTMIGRNELALRDGGRRP